MFAYMRTSGTDQEGGIFTQRRGGTERETEKTRSEEMARRHNLRPAGGFPPGDREGWGLGKVSVIVNKRG